jgi:hypothetical protein
MNTYDQPVDRPGCITAYAILLWLGGGLYVLLALLNGVFGLSDPETAVYGLVTAVCIGLFAAIPIITGIGIWKMKMWGWWIVVILNSLGVAFGLLYLLIGVIAAIETLDAVALIIGALIGLAINGGILYWFLKNRALFGNKQTGQTAMGPNGELIEKPTGQSGTNATVIAVVIGVVAIFCMIPVVTIALLTLLGPQIGNVFSRITAGLGTTPVP